MKKTFSLIRRNFAFAFLMTAFALTYAGCSTADEIPAQTVEIKLATGDLMTRSSCLCDPYCSRHANCICEFDEYGDCVRGGCQCFKCHQQCYNCRCQCDINQCTCWNCQDYGCSNCECSCAYDSLGGPPKENGCLCVISCSRHANCTCELSEYGDCRSDGCQCIKCHKQCNNCKCQCTIKCTCLTCNPYECMGCECGCYECECGYGSGERPPAGTTVYGHTRVSAYSPYSNWEYTVTVIATVRYISEHEGYEWVYEGDAGLLAPNGINIYSQGSYVDIYEYDGEKYMRINSRVTYTTDINPNTYKTIYDITGGVKIKLSENENGLIVTAQ